MCVVVCVCAPRGYDGSLVHQEERRGDDALQGGLDRVPDRGGVKIPEVREGLEGEVVTGRRFRVGLDAHEDGETVERDGDGLNRGHFRVECGNKARDDGFVLAWFGEELREAVL